MKRRSRVILDSSSRSQGVREEPQGRRHGLLARVAPALVLSPTSAIFAFSPARTSATIRLVRAELCRAQDSPGDSAFLMTLLPIEFDWAIGISAVAPASVSRGLLRECNGMR